MGIKIKVKADFVIFLLLIIIFSNTKDMYYVLLFSLLHEIGHISIILLLDMQIKEITFESFGIKIEPIKKRSSYLKEILLSLSGAICNIVMAVIMYLCSAHGFMTINLALAAFNLLPLQGNDGHKALTQILCIFFSQHMGEKIADYISIITTVIVIATLGFVVVMQDYSLLAILAAAISVISIFKRLK